MIKLKYSVNDVIKFLEGLSNEFWYSGYHLKINRAYFIDRDNTDVEVFHHYTEETTEAIVGASEIVGNFNLQPIENGCILIPHDNYIDAKSDTTHLKNFLERLSVEFEKLGIITDDKPSGKLNQIDVSDSTAQEKEDIEDLLNNPKTKIQANYSRLS